MAEVHHVRYKEEHERMQGGLTALDVFREL